MLMCLYQPCGRQVWGCLDRMGEYMASARFLMRPPFRCGADEKHKWSFETKERYLTTSQLARRWGVSSVTVIRLIEQKELSGLKIRGSYRISARSIEEYELKVAF